MHDSAMPDVKIDRSTTLAHRVEEQLRRQIVKGEYVAGSRLNEVEIAAAFDVSRGPVREALQRVKMITPSRPSLTCTDLFQNRRAINV